MYGVSRLSVAFVMRNGTGLPVEHESGQTALTECQAYFQV